MSDSPRQNDHSENGTLSVLSLPAWLRKEPAVSMEEAREELEALSYDDQVRVERGKFGMIGYPVEETPELIALAMEELEEALSTMSAEKEAYETMLFIDPEYVQSEEFQLPFLRADLFNTSAAARRIVDYWEHKVQLFGTEKGLKRHISLLDLKEEDYKGLKMSGIELLPGVDEAGRAIIFKRSNYFSSTADSMLRLDWYMVHAAIFDRVRERSMAIQKKGFVYILMCGDSEPVTCEYDAFVVGFESWTEMRKYNQSMKHHIESVLPMRVPMAFHIFAFNRWSVAFMERGLFLLGEKYRVKCCIHCNNGYREEALEMVEDDYGDEQANLIALQAYGIDREIIPTELGGDFDHDAQTFLRDRLEKDLALAEIDLDSNPGWENKLPSGLRELIHMYQE